MKMKKLGRTDLMVSELSMGGVFIMSNITQLKDAKGAVQAALEAGINLFDTAPAYGDSETVLGQCLSGITTPVILSTKLGGRPNPFDPRDKVGLRQSVEQSLKNLGVEKIDLLLIHEPDRKEVYDWYTDPEAFTGPVTELLDELKSEGLIGYSGLGGVSAYELAHVMRSGRFDVVLTAFNYSLLWREAEHEIFPAATEMNMGVIAGSPLQQGVFAKRLDDKLEDPRSLSKPRREQFLALYALADELEMPIPELAIRFVISNPVVSTVLMGAKNRQEVESNVAAIAKGVLPGKVLARLDEINAMVPYKPLREPLGWPFWR